MKETDEPTNTSSPSEGDQWPNRRLESLNDIAGEIADRRIEQTFGDLVSPEKKPLLHNLPNEQESESAFANRYEERAGTSLPEGVVGYSTHLGEAGHVLKQEVPDTVTTEIHESLHRLEDPHTTAELNRSLNEGITEHLTQRAAVGLEGARNDAFYPDETARARDFVAQCGEGAVEEYYFNHNMTDALRKALETLPGEDS